MILEYDLTRTASAGFSPCRRYRYTLRRCFRGTVDEPPRNPLIVCMCNPSFASHLRLDLTVQRLCGWTVAWDYSDLIVANAFGLQSSNPNDLLTADDPIGSENDAALASLPSGTTIIAWGNHSALRDRVPEIIRLLDRPLFCLAVNDDGSPRHPLSRGKGRIPNDVRLRRWAPPEAA